MFTFQFYHCALGKLPSLSPRVKLLSVEVEFLKCRKEKNFLRLSQEGGLLWKVLLMV